MIVVEELKDLICTMQKKKALFIFIYEKYKIMF